MFPSYETSKVSGRSSITKDALFPLFYVPLMIRQIAILTLIEAILLLLAVVDDDDDDDETLQFEETPKNYN